MDLGLDVLLLTYFLAPWCRVFLEKLTGLQLVKKFSAFHGTRRFITALTSVRHLSILGQPNAVHIPTSHLLEVYPNIHPLRLGLPSGLFPSGFPTKTLYTLPPHPYAPHAQPLDVLLLIHISLFGTWFGI